MVTLLWGFAAWVGASPAAYAWGSEGHVFTADVAVRSLPDGPLADLFTANQVWFETNSSMPGRWRYRDYAEAPRQYLHAEAFGHGTDLTLLPRTAAGIFARRTYDRLRTDGILPWAAADRFQLLVNAFREQRWDDAMVQAVFVSHYVGDAACPLHAIENDDGQLSNPSQAGIAERFEDETIGRSITARDLRPGEPAMVIDPATAIIEALQDSAREAPGILRMDQTAVAAARDTNYSDAYWRVFLPLARPVAIARLEQGGRLLAGMLSAAWREAGSPTPPAQFVMTNDLLPFAPDGSVSGPDDPAADYPAFDDDVLDAARSDAETFEIASKRLDRTVATTVLLPRDYDPHGSTRYPVLYLLHGSGGSHSDWNDQTGIAAYAANREIIVVLLDSAGDSWYVDSPKGGYWADYLDHELLPYVDRHYLTIPRREGRAVAGNSMGGFGAWYVGLTFPRRFCVAASLSGALDFGSGSIAAQDEEGGYARALFGDVSDPAAARAYAACALLPLIEHHVQDGVYNGPALYFDDGRDDYLDGANRAMEQSLLTLGVPYEFAEFAGSHDWNFWDAHARDMLNFVLRHVARPEHALRSARLGPLAPPFVSRHTRSG
jgi:S-formylglutathione hydrolase FrmB